MSGHNHGFFTNVDGFHIQRCKHDIPIGFECSKCKKEKERDDHK